ncbi:hypothetical protein CHS0354_023111 [Potamilus streckersoni]|uniref:Uncharacterized protein n=1 Tax=Potamilus streckersoni TaxID=2493646 RepID=A0AAE0TF05_9BIVA|nr:hypothetical protein CHS0354_023111 [Potamilus streckersoni]
MDPLLSSFVKVSCLSIIMILVISHAEECVEPSDEELRHQQNDEADDIHWSFWMLPEMKDMIPQLNEINETNVNRLAHMISVGVFSHTDTNSVQYTSSCSMIQTGDPQTSCQGTKKLSLDRCRPLSTYTRVLRKIGCENGVYKYEPVMEEIPIACTCLPTIAVKVASS